MTMTITSTPMCTTENSTWFFSDSPKLQTRAKALCGGCPLRADCLEQAMTIERATSKTARKGIFGGLTADQRYELDRKRWPGEPLRRPSVPHGSAA